jgi:hypothetical protein
MAPRGFSAPPGLTSPGGRGTVWADVYRAVSEPLLPAKIAQVQLPDDPEGREMCESLIHWLGKARRGELRSLAIVGVTGDGATPSAIHVGQQGDGLRILRLILADDIMAARS